jgi:putative oxidoreductase
MREPKWGRFLIGLLFVVSGLSKLIGWRGAAAYMSMHGVPLVPVALFIALVVELVCGLMLWTGFGTGAAAKTLFWYVGLVTLFMHTNNPSPFADPVQMAALLKNLAIMGGLLYVSAFSAQWYGIEHAVREVREEARKPEVVRR